MPELQSDQRSRKTQFLHGIRAGVKVIDDKKWFIGQKLIEQALG